MKILLTGGAGYIGSHAAVALLDAGHDIVIVDNLCNSQASVLTAIEHISGKKIDFVQGDIRDKVLLKDIFTQHAIDGVIHFAGLKAVGESVREPLAYFDNNVAGTITLLQVMDESKVRTLVFSSSATVYGKPKYLPFDELHPTGPINPYGHTKLQVEEILKDLAGSDSSWHIASLRYFNPVGAHESGLIGESPRGIPNNLMPFLARVADGSLTVLQIYGNDYPTPDGTGVRDYIHVMDLAEGHHSAFNFLKSNDGFHVFNLGNGVGISVMQLVNQYQDSSGVSIKYQISARRAGDIAEFYADPSKAKRDLGWKCHRSLADMCDSSWNFQKRNQGMQLL